MNNSRKSIFKKYAGWVGLFVFFLGSITPYSVLAADKIYRVIPEGISSGACGESWSTACTLQNAIALSSTGDQIWVAGGTYKPTSSTDRAVTFTLKDGVAVYGGFVGTETDLSQRDPSVNVTLLSGDIGAIGDITDNSYHVIYGPNLSSSSVLDGFTISWGNANGDQPTAKNRGGGIYFYQSSATLRNLTISNNSTSNLGGGMAITYGSNPSLTNVVFSDNTGPYGGAIYSLNSDPVLTDVFFYTNTATP